MLYNDFQDISLSRLGFGTMRLPLKDGEIDQAQVEAMTDYAIEHGINYFDTAYPYMSGKSELSIGKALAKYPRESYYLADKYPGHQIVKHYDPAGVFEDQLQKCGVEYFDFYLLHNVYEESMKVYEDPQWGIIDYFLEQKKQGRIRHLGFSSHARADALEAFLDRHLDILEFCQIQLNYLDWTLQEAERKYEILTERNIPIWVMESVRGGRLANLSDADNAKLKALRPDESIASWGFRWLQGLPNCKMILSGMSSLDQMKDNVKTFSGGQPLSGEERQLLLDIAEGMKGALPCTGCRYCCDGCPMGLDIPMLIHAYNDVKFASSMTVAMQFDALPDDRKPSACIACGACAAVCPQNIDIPAALAELADALGKMPSWAELCRQREEAARKLKEQKGTF